MNQVALCLLWQDGDPVDIQRALDLSQIVPRVYIVDRRLVGERFGGLPDPRLHYAPFRQEVSLGTALNRALRLAYEEERAWLWILDGSTYMAQEHLRAWSQKASASVGLYGPEKSRATLDLFQRPPCGQLVSVPVARALGGWNPVLPAQLVFGDFVARLKAAGGAVENSLKIHRDLARHRLDPWETGRSLWLWVQWRFLRKW